MKDKLFIFILYVFFAKAQYEGESCIKGSLNGVCRLLRNCQPAIEDIKNRIPPQRCSFFGTEPIVCCVESKPSVPVSSSTTTTEYTPDYEDEDNSVNSCPPLSSDFTTSKTGQKAWDKCIEYQEKYVYPCERSVALTGGMTRGSHCGHNADELIIGGIDAGNNEFPHMVLLGFGTDPRSAQWLCGGSLISEKFILTAGHCTSNVQSGDVSYAALGTMKRSNINYSKVYKIGRIIKHPGYKSPNKYNDIALLETEQQMHLDQYAVPACLDVGNIDYDDRASATGFGVVQYRGPAAENLQKVILTKYSTQECAAKFPPARLMLDGFREATQICFGDKTKSKDTCQGDSGGPLQVKNKQIHCMYTIIGVTSFGKACGIVGEPGIYTRVSAFVPWIEKIVWP